MRTRNYLNQRETSTVIKSRSLRPITSKRGLRSATTTKRKLFQVLEQLLHQKQAQELPSFTEAKKLAEALCMYFITNIEKIMQKIDAKHPTALMENQDCSQLEETLPAFELFTEEEILKVIKATKNSTCELNSIPTTLLKECVGSLLPTIMKIMNLSLSSGIVPLCLKHAIVRPHLKNHMQTLKIHKLQASIKLIIFV